jgi:deoxyribose-phosphate aldolase
MRALLGDSSALPKTSVTLADLEAVEGRKLHVSEAAIITPAARDRARELGIELVTSPVLAGASSFDPSEESLVASLADQLARDLSGRDADELTCSCRTECLTKCPQRIVLIAQAGADRIGINGSAPPLDDGIAALIDHTLLRADATEAQIKQLCREAAEYCFASVCIHPYYVPLAADLLCAAGVDVCTVAGFPLGANMTETKASEAAQAVESGATEIDMVINVGALKSARYEWVKHDIARVVESSHPKAIVKVIIEAALLTDEEKVIACELARDAGAEFVKTSTGFGPGGATTDDVALMRRTVGAGMGVKAAGGIGDREKAAEMIAAGATRIGASAGVRIARGL